MDAQQSWHSRGLTAKCNGSARSGNPVIATTLPFLGIVDEKPNQSVCFCVEARSDQGTQRSGPGDAAAIVHGIGGRC